MVTPLDWTPTFKRPMARFVVENDTKKTLCYDEIGICILNMLIILGSTTNNTSGRASVSIYILSLS